MSQAFPHKLVHGRFRKRPGSVPGRIDTPPGAPPPQIRMIAYGEDGIETCDGCSHEQIADWHRQDRRLWVDVAGLGDADSLGSLAREFGIHPLAMEDVAHVGQRPKVDPYEGFLLIVLYDPHLHHERPQMEQVAIVLGRDWVLSFQEQPGDPFDPIRERLRDDHGELRRRGCDYLAYALIDALVDGYFPVVDELSTRLDQSENRLFDLVEELPTRIRTTKRGLITLRRTLRPLRDAIGSLHATESTLVGPETRYFLRDVSDHVDQLLDQVELDHDLAADQLQTFLNLAAHRQSQVTEVLTVIATIFLPLTFIAGVYGMNFDPEHRWNMPELGWAYGYPGVMLLMAAIAIGMLIIFRRRGWIGGRRRR